jgi:hypothetical protein
MNENQLLDLRIVERNINAGKLSREDYKKFLSGLEDCADEAAETETEMVRHIADDDDGGDEA